MTCKCEGILAKLQEQFTPALTAWLEGNRGTRGVSIKANCDKCGQQYRLQFKRMRGSTKGGKTWPG